MKLPNEMTYFELAICIEHDFRNRPPLIQKYIDELKKVQNIGDATLFGPADELIYLMLHHLRISRIWKGALKDLIYRELEYRMKKNDVQGIGLDIGGIAKRKQQTKIHTY